MNEQCPHAAREDIIAAMKEVGWNNTHETKKVLLFEKDGQPIYFNGQDNGRIHLVFHPILAGSNFTEFCAPHIEAEDRFMSNYRAFPQKPSRGQPLNFFGVGCKFDTVEKAAEFVRNLQIPVLQ